MNLPTSSSHLRFFHLLDPYDTLRNQRREQNRYQDGDNQAGESMNLGISSTTRLYHNTRTWRMLH